MIEEQGTVIGLAGPYARVRTRRRSACGTCSVQGACGTSLLERYLGRRMVELTAFNQANAVVGDRVLIGISEHDLLSAAVAAYLVPILALLAGALIGDAVGGLHAEIISLFGAILGLALAMIWLRGYSVLGARHPLVLRRLEVNSIAMPLPGA